MILATALYIMRNDCEWINSRREPIVYYTHRIKCDTPSMPPLSYWPHCLAIEGGRAKSISCGSLHSPSFATLQSTFVAIPLSYSSMSWLVVACVQFRSPWDERTTEAVLFDWHVSWTTGILHLHLWEFMLCVARDFGVYLDHGVVHRVEIRFSQRNQYSGGV